MKIVLISVAYVIYAQAGQTTRSGRRIERRKKKIKSEEELLGGN